MADSCQIDLKGCSATISRKYTETRATERFKVLLDASNQDPIDVCNRARTANPTRFPIPGQSWPVRPSYGLFADTFTPTAQDSNQKFWLIDVNYLPLQPNESNTEGTNDNPLAWPAVRNLEWIEYEQIIEEARNVEEFGGLSAPGKRPANTLGRIENSARQEPDEGLFATHRDPVLCITRNYASIDAILAVGGNYARTTNSDTLFGIGPRRFEFLGIESSGQLTANGITYYPGTVRVRLAKTTDRTMNNVGWHHWKPVQLVGHFPPDEDEPNKLVKNKVKEYDDNGDILEDLVDPAEPLFLDMDGGFTDGTAPTKITWRYLEEVPYAPILL